MSESPSTVNQWVKRRRPVPVEKGPAIELAVGGQVTVERLFPDEKWTRIADPSWPNPSGRPVLDFAKDHSQPAEV